MDLARAYLNRLKNGNPDHDYVIDDALFHVARAQEALTEGLADPVEWRARGAHTAATLAKGFPYLWFISESLLTSPSESAEPRTRTASEHFGTTHSCTPEASPSSQETL